MAWCLRWSFMITVVTWWEWDISHCAQNLLLTLRAGTTPASAHRTIWDTRRWKQHWPCTRDALYLLCYLSMPTTIVVSELAADQRIHWSWKEEAMIFSRAYLWRKGVTERLVAWHVTCGEISLFYCSIFFIRIKVTWLNIKLRNYREWPRGRTRAEICKGGSSFAGSVVNGLFI